ncbi:TRADD-N-associated membrane domain-containing protein [Herpetosiphon geysericola]|uniref:TRADD-N-associated membrane domain-containing protein n=1 Tax=Herpetosiphon geysericola TaxID=70996 RepID=UPI0006C92DA8|nr:hypothetical protein [Herpetosiphon geysericola]
MTDLQRVLIPIIAFLLSFSVPGLIRLIEDIISQKIRSYRIESADKKASENPEKIKPSWDAARIRLESYFDINIAQTRSIYRLSLTAMVSGFGIVVLGIVQYFKTDNATPTILAGVGGIITEIIGATFMVMYKSTMEHASNYIKTLERMNSVGMAMQILDTMPDDTDQQRELRNTTKTEVIKILMQQAHAGEPPTKQT